MSKRYRAFVSSASDMRAERDEVIRAIRACDCEPCVMEDWTAGQKSPLRRILEQIDLSDFFILLLGNRYGERPPWTEDDLQAAPNANQEWSYVMIEYEHARERRMPIIALLSEESTAESGDSSDPTGQLQKAFRKKIRNTLSTKTWTQIGELRAYVTSSLLDNIRPRESCLVVQTNADLIAEVSAYLNTRSALNEPAREAVLIQYSSRNVRDILRKLLWSGVRTKVYVVAHDWALEHQKPIVEEGLHALTNHLEPIAPQQDINTVMSLLEIYRYKAPASLRAISIDDRLIAIGSYVYMKKKRRITGEALDIRGGELPMMIFQKKHAGFSVLKGMIDGLLKNWHSNGVVDKWDNGQADGIF